MIYSPYYLDSLRRRSLRIVTQTTEEQIDIALARSHLRLDAYGSPESHPDDDLLTTVYIPAAREICEGLSGRALVPQTYELGLAKFPCGGISLQVGPVANFTSIIYADPDGVDQTMDAADYRIDQYAEPGYVYPAPNGQWPTALLASNSIRIRFEAGYNLPTASPQDLPLPRKYLSAMLLVLGHLYENREQTTVLKLEELPMGVQSLLSLDALRMGFA
jgi:uncharacterized phiE125 gp8 family phage protein